MIHTFPYGSGYWPTKITAPLKIHGGKSYLCRRFFGEFNCDYDTFVDVFGGSGVMTLNAPIGVRRIYNDLDAQKVNVMGMIKHRTEELSLILQSTTYSRKSFEKAGLRLKICSNDLELAAAYIVRNRMSRGGLGKDFSESTRLRGGQNEGKNAWESAVASIPLVSSRLAGVDLQNREAQTLLSDSLSPNLSRFLFYLDPPYFPSTRTGFGGEYEKYEMTIADHEVLLAHIQNAPCKIAISGYGNNYLYDRELIPLKGWRQLNFEIANSSGQGKTKQRRVESLWLNW